MYRLRHSFMFRTHTSFYVLLLKASNYECFLWEIIAKASRDVLCRFESLNLTLQVPPFWHCPWQVSDNRKKIRGNISFAFYKSESGTCSCYRREVDPCLQETLRVQIQRRARAMKQRDSSGSPRKHPQKTESCMKESGLVSRPRLIRPGRSRSKTAFTESGERRARGAAGNRREADSD